MFPENELIKTVLREWAKSQALVLRLWLVGSRARGDHRPYSDVDIVLDLDGSSSNAGPISVLVDNKCWQHQLEEKLQLPVHIIAYELCLLYLDPPKQEEWSVREMVERDGVLLFPPA